MADKAELDELTPQQAQAAVYRAQGMSQSDAYRRAYNVRRAKPKTVHEKASRLFAQDKMKARVRELLRQARVTDIDSVGQAFDHLLRLLEKAEQDGNYNAAAQLMRQRLQTHGLLRDRIVLSAESQLTDEQLLERLSGGDPERLAAARVLLGAGDGFPENYEGETKH
jgi:hypothetical protein